MRRLLDLIATLAWFFAWLRATATEGLCSMTDYSEAAARLLELIVAKLRAGYSPQDLGEQVTLIGRLLERKT